MLLLLVVENVLFTAESFAAPSHLYTVSYTGLLSISLSLFLFAHIQNMGKGILIFCSTILLSLCLSKVKNLNGNEQM